MNWCAPIHARLADRLVRIAGDAVAATAVMVLSDYRKGVLAGDTPTRLIAAARTAGRKVLVDPKGGNHARYAGADLIMPDVEELAEATGLPVGTEAEIAAAAAALRRAHGFGAVMVIRGEPGVTLVTGDAAGEIVQHMPSDVAEVVDSSGASDVVVAVAAAGLAAGLPLAVIARLGALAAGIVLGKTGIAVVREDEFLEALTPGRLATRKLATRSEAAERVERWRRAGQPRRLPGRQRRRQRARGGGAGAQLVRPAGGRARRCRPGGGGAGRDAGGRPDRPLRRGDAAGADPAAAAGRAGAGPGPRPLHRARRRPGAGMGRHGAQHGRAGGGAHRGGIVRETE